MIFDYRWDLHFKSHQRKLLTEFNKAKDLSHRLGQCPAGRLPFAPKKDWDRPANLIINDVSSRSEDTFARNFIPCLSVCRTVVSFQSVNTGLGKSSLIKLLTLLIEICDHLQRKRRLVSHK